MKYQPKLEKIIMCPLEQGLNVFGGKWKSRIICVLSTREATRYNELKKELNNITDAVLASMLKELIADQLISRQQYNEVPPRVEYALTEKGRSVLPVLQTICQWSRKNENPEVHLKLRPCRNCDQL
jgi:Predicted transcriptional regulators